MLESILNSHFQLASLRFLAAMLAAVQSQNAVTTYLVKIDFWHLFHYIKKYYTIKT